MMDQGKKFVIEKYFETDVAKDDSIKESKVFEKEELEKGEEKEKKRIKLLKEEKKKEKLLNKEKKNFHSNRTKRIHPERFLSNKAETGLSILFFIVFAIICAQSI